MNNTDPTLPMAHPPISSSSDMRPRDTLLQRGAFDPPATPGTLGRLDRFEILRLIGEGGMGQVYLAREPLTDTQVAIKIMKPDAADDPREVHRFLTEARHMYRLSHPRILRVLEVSDRPAGPYYVMPFIAGGSLLARCKPGETLPEAEVLSIARQVAEALAHAHAHGLIHRDLKPGNVLLDKDGNAYLTDFGLVRTLFNDSMVDATASHLEGTAPYMSPAVARGEAEDTRCDIYAFGALLFELLAGQPPYTGRSPQIILDQVLKGPPVPLREVNPKASPALVRIAEGCMARELRDRYASMADVVADLERAAKGELPLGVHPQRQRRSPRLTVALFGLLGVALVALAGVAVNHFRPGTRATPTEKADALSSARVIPSVASEPAPTNDYIYTSNNDAITITKYMGASGAVVIPETIGGHPVVGIQNEAFMNRTDLTSVVIPNGVTNIGYAAFRGCAKLTNVTIGNGVATIEAWVFCDCAYLADVTIPASVTCMAGNAFGLCNRLRSIIVDDANPIYCSDADGVVFNKDKTILVRYPSGKEGAFVIPSNVAQIGIAAFESSPGLTGLTIPESVTNVGNSAFWNDTNLTRIFFQGNAPDLGTDTLHGANKATIYYRPGTKGWGKEFGGRPTAVWEETGTGASTAHSLQPPSPAPTATDIHDFACVAENGGVAIVKYTGEGGAVVIPAKVSGRPVTAIKDTAFQNCTTLTGLVIPESVTNIAPNAFAGCHGMKAITLGGIKSIPNDMFNGYTNLTSIVIPDSVTNIGNDAFKNCTGLDKVTILNGVTRIGNSAFYGCTRLTRVTLPASVTSMDMGWGFPFSGCSNLVEIAVDILNPTYSSDADGVLFNKERTTLLRYPLGKGGNYTIPKRVIVLGDLSFYGCTNLTGIEIPNGVTRIDGGTFSGCSGLTSITIPASVSSIYPWAFSGCGGLKSIQVDKSNPVFFSNTDGVVFSKDKKTLVRFPSGRSGDYTIPSHVVRIGMEAFIGSTVLTAITIPDSVTALDNGAFRDCHKLRTVYIPDSVTSIGNCAFFGCENLVNVTLPNRLTRIEYWTFSGCAITNMTIPASVTFIGEHAFGGPGLASIVIPNSVTNIAGWAFNWCLGLKSVSIPDSITIIESGTFASCTNLTEVTVPNSVTNICAWAFRDCTSLTNMTVSGSVANIGNEAFANSPKLKGVYFKGDAPNDASDKPIFQNSGNTTVYYRLGTKGWGATFGGRPTAVWEEVQ